MFLSPAPLADKNKAPAAHAKFQAIKEAYDVLSDVQRKWVYDRMSSLTPPGSHAGSNGMAPSTSSTPGWSATGTNGTGTGANETESAPQASPWGDSPGMGRRFPHGPGAQVPRMTRNTPPTAPPPAEKALQVRQPPTISPAAPLPFPPASLRQSWHQTTAVTHTYAPLHLVVASLTRNRGLTV